MIPHLLAAAPPPGPSRHQAVCTANTWPARLAQSRRWGADLREAEPAQLADRLSYYQPAGEQFALWCPEDIYIEKPATLIQAYLTACRLRGAEVAENEPVIGIAVTAGRVRGVETPGRPVTAPVVVDAAGGWVRQVAELAGARVPVAPVRHQLLITAPAAEIDPADPITRVVDAAVYLRPARGGLMFGGFEADPLPVDPQHQPAAFTTDDVPLDLGLLRQLAAQITAEAPAGIAAPVAEHRGGLFTMSPDGRFVAGPCRACLACGWPAAASGGDDRDARVVAGQTCEDPNRFHVRASVSSASQEGSVISVDKRTPLRTAHTEPSRAWPMRLASETTPRWLVFFGRGGPPGSLIISGELR